MDAKKSKGVIPLLEAARLLDIGYTSIRRYYKQLVEDGMIETEQMIKARTGHISKGLTQSQINYIRKNYMAPVFNQHEKKQTGSDDGVFYVILLVPEFSKTRIKVGFTENIDARLRSHMVSAPTAEVLKTYPCKRSWEGYLLAVVERHGKCIRTEVFDIPKLDPLLRDLATAFRLAKI